MRHNGTIILLVFYLTLLLLTGCIVNKINAETARENLENQANTEEPVMWSGLGMVLCSSEASYVDTLLANGFTELRIDIPDYQNTSWLASSKATLPGIIAKGAKVIWGVSSNDYNNADYTITAENWPTFRQAILDAAEWAQDNGVYEFQIGNEEEAHVDGTTMTADQVITNLKSVATAVQEIFTNGNVSYSCYHWNIDDWVSAGKGDIDLLASNVYRLGGDDEPSPWEDEIDALVGAFGTDGTYLTEFSLSSHSLDSYSTDEAVQATALTEMIEYIKASGMTRAYYYAWKNDEFGVVKNDGTYRLLWSQALLNIPVKSTIF